MKTGTANLPLHTGRAPAWLFRRMVRLAREISRIVIEEFGPDELLNRLSDPFWFQAFGCVLGFDWHSSGVTTTACGALKEGLRPLQKETGLFVCGGKGGVSRRTPQEIETACDATGQDAAHLVHASRISAKVDSAAIQDGYQLYHHCFIFTTSGLWCVVQQGMNDANRTARRYHWLSTGVKDFVCEPHHAICCDRRGAPLNLVAGESADNRSAITQLAAGEPGRLQREIARFRELHLPERHALLLEDIDPRRLNSILLRTYEAQAQDFETVLGTRGLGAKSLRALSLIAELVYGARPSFRDPARFSYAHGGKDGTPYPVARETCDRSIEVLRDVLDSARVGAYDKLRAMRRLARFEADIPRRAGRACANSKSRPDLA